MIKKTKFVIILILLAFISPANAATIYKWVDEKGVVNFTDTYNNIPSFYRDRVEVRHYIQEGVTPDRKEGLAPAYGDVSSQTRAEVKTDLYGRDETWWKEKVRPWKEQLKGATKDYENVHKQYMEQSEGLSPYTFGKMSLTQYQMLSAKLQILNTEMEKYQDQIAEANEKLSKLSQEAKETKADPSWLE